MFAGIYHNYPHMWNRSIAPDSSKLKGFWEFMDQNPAMLGHPVKTRVNYKALAVPLSFHGDEVPIVGLGMGWAKLMATFSWASLLGAGSTIQTMHYRWSAFTALCKTGDCDGTFHMFFRILAWSFEALWVGKWPMEDWNGKVYLDLI